LTSVFDIQYIEAQHFSETNARPTFELTASSGNEQGKGQEI
jgi:hypothetical protein